MHSYRFKSAVVFILFLFAIQGYAKSTPVSDSLSAEQTVQAIAKEGFKQLSSVLAYNAENERSIRSQNNIYIFGDLAAVECLAAKDFVLTNVPGAPNQGDLGLHQLLTNELLAEINGNLNTINNSLAENNANNPIIFIGLDGFIGKTVGEPRVNSTTGKTFISTVLGQDINTMYLNIFSQIAGYYNTCGQSRPIIIISLGQFFAVKNKGAKNFTDADVVAGIGYLMDFTDSRTTGKEEFRKKVLSLGKPKVAGPDNASYTTAILTFANNIANVAKGNVTMVNCNDFLKQTTGKKITDIIDKDELYNYLIQFNLTCFELLKIDERIHILNKIASYDHISDKTIFGYFFSAVSAYGGENIVLATITTAKKPEDQLALVNYFKSNAYQKLFHYLNVMDDAHMSIIASDNYSKFVTTLANYTVVNYNNVTVSPDKIFFWINGRLGDLKSYDFDETPLKTFSSTIYKLDETRNGVEDRVYNLKIYNREILDNGGATETLVSTITIDPFEPIILWIQDDNENIGQWTLKAEDGVPVPGFYLSWLLQKNRTESIKKSIRVTLATAGLISGVGTFVTAASYTTATIAAIDIAMTSTMLANENSTFNHWFKGFLGENYKYYQYMQFAWGGFMLGRAGFQSLPEATRLKIVGAAQSLRQAIRARNVTNFRELYSQEYEKIRQIIYKLTGQNLDDVADAYAIIRENVIDYIKKNSAFIDYFKLSEKNALIAKGKSYSNLTDKEIEGIILQSCRSEKAKTYAETLARIEYYATLIKQRGFPFKFTSLANFNQFKTRIQNLLSECSISYIALKIKGSSLLDINAKDVDVVVEVSSQGYNNLLKQFYKKGSNSISKIGEDAIDIENYSSAELSKLAADIRANKDLYNAHAWRFSGSYQDRIMILKSSFVKGSPTKSFSKLRDEIIADFNLGNIKDGEGFELVVTDTGQIIPIIPMLNF